MLDSTFTAKAKPNGLATHFGELISGLFRPSKAKRLEAAFETLQRCKRERDWAKAAYDAAKKRRDTRLQRYWADILDTRVHALLAAELAVKAVSA